LIKTTLSTFLHHKLNNNFYYYKIAEEVNISLDKHFPGDDVKIIAEPGHFYVASAFTMVTNIIARRVVDSYDQGLYSLQNNTTMRHYTTIMPSRCIED
jgi:ornithine decarboxylase